MIEVSHLTKWYGPTLAVDDISFSIPKGQIVGFLGPNGAGKSTTLRILTGYIPMTSGSAKVADFDVQLQSSQARAAIGYLPESTPLYGEMRVVEYLHYRGKLLGMSRSDRNKRIDIVAERCGLSAIKRRLIGQLSKGNKQRVGLAQALLHNPPVLILDEPTAGLDPNQIGEVRKLITELKGDHTIILSSHILPEVEKVADRAIIIAGGTIRADGALSELREQVSDDSVIEIELKATPESAQKAISAVEGVTKVEVISKGEWCQLAVLPEQGKDTLSAIAETTLKNGWAVRKMAIESVSLEEFFISITADQGAARKPEVA